MGFTVLLHILVAAIASYSGHSDSYVHACMHLTVHSYGCFMVTLGLPWNVKHASLAWSLSNNIPYIDSHIHHCRITLKRMCSSKPLVSCISYHNRSIRSYVWQGTLIRILWILACRVWVYDSDWSKCVGGIVSPVGAVCWPVRSCLASTHFLPHTPHQLRRQVQC